MAELVNLLKIKIMSEYKVKRIIAKVIVITTIISFMTLLHKYWIDDFYAFSIIGVVLVFSWALAELEV